MSFYNAFKNYLRSLHPGYYKKLDSNKVYIKYVIGGGAATVIDLGLLYILTDIFHVWYLYSASLAFLAAFFVSFYLQKFWTFRDNSNKKIHKQIALYFTVGAANLGINMAGMYILVEKLNFMYILAQIIIGAIIAVSSFLIYKFIIFKKNKVEISSRQDGALKILIAAGIFSPDIGGPATYSKLLVDELPKRGIEVEVLSFGSVRHLPKIIRHAAYFLKVLKAGRGADIIYAQDPVSVGLPSCIAAKILKKKIIIRIAGDYAWEQGTQRFAIKDNIDEFSTKQKGYHFFVQLLKKIQTRVAKSANLIIVPSRYFKKIISNWGVEPEKINVIYNGIEPQGRFNSRPSSREKIILSTGRFVPWKGFKALIETMPDILREIPKARLVIVGSGPQQPELERAIIKLNLKDKVSLTGQLKRDELLKQKQLAGVFVLNSGFESFSFDTVEAMALELPVVVTRIGSLPELVEDDKEGIIIELDNKQEIKQAVVRIFQDDSFRQKIIQNAYQKSHRFSIQNTLDQLEKLLH